MAKRTEEKRIGDQSWQVTQYVATEGLAIMARLFKLVGPTIGKAIGGVRSTGVGGKGGILDMDLATLNLTSFGDAVMTLADRLDEREVVDLVKRMLAEVRVNGAEILPQFDLVFMGDYGKLFAVLRFVLEVNYGSFFGGVSAAAAKAKTTSGSELQ